MSINRRTFVIRSAVGAIGLVNFNLANGEDAKLPESDPLAIEHGYKLDPKKVDMKKFPKYDAGQICGTCQLYEEHSKEWGGCAVFPGKLVHVGAWCDAWG